MAFNIPDYNAVQELFKAVNIDQEFVIQKHAILVKDLQEQMRYFLQHNLGFQVNDIKYPHLPKRHGRSEIGWQELTSDN